MNDFFFRFWPQCKKRNRCSIVVVFFWLGMRNNMLGKSRSSRFLLCLSLNQRLTWKVRLAKLCLSCLRTLVFCLLLDCIHAHSKCILRMNALLWFLYMLSNFDGKTYIPYQQNINTYLLMLYLLILYTHSSINKSSDEYFLF